MKKKLLKNSRLYLILDRAVLDYSAILCIANQAVRAGVDILQLRDKISSDRDFLSLALKLRKITQRKKTAFIVNDRLDAAILSRADGVHLGQEDFAFKPARRLLGRNKIIGISCHNFSQAASAQKEGADYIGLGPVFSTLTKPGLQAIGLEVISKVSSRLKIPFFAIGGISLSNASLVLSAGADRIAVCRAICCHREVFKTCKIFLEILKEDKK